MQQIDLFLIFTVPLDSAGLKYMVGGSVASMVYGEPRLTNDIDIILDLDYRRVATLAALFPPESFYCPPEEVLIIESRRQQRGHFNIIHHATGHKADIYLCGGDALQHWGLAHVRPVEIEEGRSLKIAPPEYVILRKLEYFKEGGSQKHKLDIRGMLAVSGDLLDQPFLDEWIDRLAVRREWLEVSGNER